MGWDALTTFSQSFKYLQYDSYWWRDAVYSPKSKVHSVARLRLALLRCKAFFQVSCASTWQCGSSAVEPDGWCMRALFRTCCFGQQQRNFKASISLMAPHADVACFMLVRVSSPESVVHRLRAASLQFIVHWLWEWRRPSRWPPWQLSEANKVSRPILAWRSRTRVPAVHSPQTIAYSPQPAHCLCLVSWSMSPLGIELRNFGMQKGKQRHFRLCWRLLSICGAMAAWSLRHFLARRWWKPWIIAVPQRTFLQSGVKAILSLLPETGLDPNTLQVSFCAGQCICRHAAAWKP